MAIKAQTALLSAESARAAAKTITAATAANPVVVTATAHGYANGDIVYIDSVVGMTELNGRSYVAANVATNTFELKGVDGTGFTAYASAGSAYKLTMVAVGSVSQVSGFDGQAAEIDVTHLRSTGKEYLIGLQDFGNVSLDLFMDNTDTGQALLRTIKAAASVKGFTLTLSDSKTAAFMALVKSFTFSAQKEAAVTAQVTLRVSGAPAWFA